MGAESENRGGETTTKGAGSAEGRLRRLWRGHIRPLGIVVLALFSFRSAVADWYDVPTGSMKPTIIEGDRILVNKMAYDLKVPFTLVRLAEWGDPVRGDIVVFRSPADGKRLVKRVVGVPGDTIELRGNRLIVNGAVVGYEELDWETVSQVAAQERTKHRFAREDLPARAHAVMTTPGVASPRTFGPVTVPAGKYFMMGDNRDMSADSRFFGFVDRRAIVGRSRRVALSLDESYVPRVGRFLRGLR
jgi:signal peptidase I